MMPNTRSHVGETGQRETNSKDSHANMQLVAQAIGLSPRIVEQHVIVEQIQQSPALATQRTFLAGLMSAKPTIQRAVEDESNLEEFETTQRVVGASHIQDQALTNTPTQLQAEPAAKPNNTGLPDNLKSGIESLSGISMDGVKVHYRSPQPAQLNALAYAQGTDIHVAPGQEQHLPHEAWHVVQQAQGRVQPTMQMKAGVPINDDPGLEHEADVMGARAVQLQPTPNFIKSAASVAPLSSHKTVQKATEDGLEKGSQVIVTKQGDQNYKKIGKVFAATDGGYEVRFGRNFVTYAHAELDNAVTSELDDDLVWSAEEMLGLDAVAFSLFSHYSPNEYAYVSLGSSPLLIIEYVRQRCVQFHGEDLLTLLTIPLSEVDDEAFLDRVDKILSGDELALEGVEGELQNLHTFMMSYASPSALGGKKPLLIDYAAGGRTLTVMRYHLMSSYIYMGLSDIAHGIEVVALNGGKDVITPSTSYRDLLSMYDNKDKIYELFGKEENTQDLEYPSIPTIDPQNQSKEFLEGLSNRKLKDEFGYRSWNKTSYVDVMKGRKKQGAQDAEGIARAQRAIAQIINILDHF